MDRAIATSTMASHKNDRFVNGRCLPFSARSKVGLISIPDSVNPEDELAHENEEGIHIALSKTSPYAGIIG